MGTKYFCVVFLLILFSLAVNSTAQTSTFHEAKGIPSDSADYYDFEKWTFTVDGSKYELNREGKGTRTGKNPREFDVPIEIDGSIDRVIYFAAYKKDILLLGELDFADTGGGFFARLDGKTLQPIWQLSIPAFNIAKGLFENDSVYLAAIGYASKIDLETGKEIWKNDGFYRKYRESGAFNIFETPQIDGNTVIYRERSIYKNPQNIIVFDKISGEVLKVLLDQ